jgi:hypothetical protein
MAGRRLPLSFRLRFQLGVARLVFVAASWWCLGMCQASSGGGGAVVRGVGFYRDHKRAAGLVHVTPRVFK